MTGNNLTYALIPRLSWGILSHRPSHSLARSPRLYYFHRRMILTRFRHEIRQVRSFIVILTCWSAMLDDTALARRPGRGGFRGAAAHSDDRAHEGIHSISAQWSMQRRCHASSLHTVLPLRCNVPFLFYLVPTERNRELLLRLQFREKESSACARALETNEIGMQTYKLHGPFRTSYQLNPADERHMSGKEARRRKFVEPLFDLALKPAIIFYNTDVSLETVIISSVISHSLSVVSRCYRSTETFPEWRSAAKSCGKEREKKLKSSGEGCHAGTGTDLISESSGIVTPVSYNSAIIKVAQGRIKRYVCPAAHLRDPFLNWK